MKPTFDPCIRFFAVLAFGLLLPASLAFAASSGAEAGPESANQPPQVRMIQPEDGFMVQAPDRLQLVAQAWDVDGRVDQVEFFADDRSLGIVKNDPDQLEPFHINWRDVPTGTHELTARAFDNQGASTLSRQMRTSSAAL